jgi:hypothetical protein
VLKNRKHAFKEDFCVKKNKKDSGRWPAVAPPPETAIGGGNSPEGMKIHPLFLELQEHLREKRESRERERERRTRRERKFVANDNVMRETNI